MLHQKGERHHAESPGMPARTVFAVGCTARPVDPPAPQAPAAPPVEQLPVPATPAAPQLPAPRPGDCDTATAEQRELWAWLAQGAFPINGVMAGADTADLQPLKDLLKDVQVVGLGEATHGTAEFFRMKHRLLEFLVKEMDYRVFAMEASYSAGLAVDEYITTGKGDPATVVHNLGFWTWDTQEVVDIVRWMQTYNENAPSDRQLRFLGFDIQVPKHGALWLTDLLNRTSPADTDEYRTLINLVTGGILADLRDPAHRQKTAERFQDLAEFLQANRQQLVERSSPDDWQMAADLTRNLTRYHDMVSAASLGEGSVIRDKYMTATLLEGMERVGPQSRVVLWAHNMHLSKTDWWMGKHLETAFGNRYYAMGFAFLQGTFRAFPKGGRVLEVHTLNPAPAGFREWHLGCALPGAGIVNLRRPAPSEAVARWLKEPHPTRIIGSIFDTDQPTPEAIANYDGMIYIPDTTAAVPMR